MFYYKPKCQKTFFLTFLYLFKALFVATVTVMSFSTNGAAPHVTLCPLMGDLVTAPWGRVCVGEILQWLNWSVM